MKIPLRTRIYIQILALAIIIVVGSLWYRDFIKYKGAPKQSVEEAKNLVNFVDRELPPELSERYLNQIADLESKLAEQGENPDISTMLTLGNAYYALGELATARNWYEKILAKYPDDVAALENNGQTLVEMGDFARAQESWIRAISKEANETTILKLVDLIDEKNPEKRLEIRVILEGAIQVLGQTTGLLTRLGEWYYDQGDYERAISHYEVARTINPDDEQITIRLEEIRKKFININAN